MHEEVKLYKDVPFVRYSRADDASELVYDLRKADLEEILHVGLNSPLEALQQGFKDSEECFTVEYLGKPIAMFGVARNPHEMFSGIIWLLGSDRLLDFKKEIIKQSRGWVDYFHVLYPKLANVVWSGNVKHIRWLKWLGFEFSEPFPLGPNNQMFFYFQKEKVDV